MWMPLFIGDYLADTRRLTLEQHGAYLMLIMDYWRNGPPPDDDETLARILAVPDTDWKRLRRVIEPYFTIAGGCWRHTRIDHEFGRAEIKQKTFHDRAVKAAAARQAQQQAHLQVQQQDNLQAGDVTFTSTFTEKIPLPPPFTTTKEESKHVPRKRVANGEGSHVFDSYAEAYASRYGTNPVRNAKVNSQIKQII